MYDMLLASMTGMGQRRGTVIGMFARVSSVFSSLLCANILPSAM